MTNRSTYSDTPLLEPFLAYLQHAAIARQNNQHDTYAIWMQAASHLYSTAQGDVNELVLELIGHGRHDDAIALARTMTWLFPDCADVHFRLGYALQMANRHDEAVSPYRRAFEIEPDMAQLRNNLAIALRKSGADPAQELLLLEAAVSADPTECEAWINLTNAYCVRMNLTRALAAGARAVELAPTNAMALNNYAMVLKEAQRWDEAEHFARQASQCAPDDFGHRFNVTLLELQRGRYASGWPGYEARWGGSPELRSSGRPVFARPQWQGEPLAGKTLLVWGEQGMGDVLHGCRFIAPLAERVHREGGKLIWNSYPEMGDLLTRSLGHHVDGYTAGGGVDRLPPFDYEVSLLSLPLLLGTGDRAMGETVPYLRADAGASAKWRARLAKEKRLKVGLAWTGSLTHRRNRYRRVDWQRYAAAFTGIEGIAFYSLQTGASGDVAAAYDAGFPIIDHTGEWETFDDTASFMSAMDVIITVCTSVAHLSGALGLRTWVLLDVNPHWIWMLERRDCPWYPTATLYRQARFGQWGSVMGDVTADLMGLLYRLKESA
ncbi:hypothetical protein C5615_32175 [Burkholderia cepacia]|uniref:Uncharacterized protein n=1 Tax=Burkholderia cepacia TaxID=292 RepID=A0A2S8I9J5_BURCE|nr:hypothetical protein C5615_32175 [Burkholderia cepacia]HDR9511014.1 tetratricopeptide repeat protein [Burkholderia cepacia]